MIILDTNVLGALMRTRPEASVIAWLDRQPAESIWITSITLLETALWSSAAAARPTAGSVRSGVCPPAKGGFGK